MHTYIHTPEYKFYWYMNSREVVTYNIERMNQYLSPCGPVYNINIDGYKVWDESIEYTVLIFGWRVHPAAMFFN